MTNEQLQCTRNLLLINKIIKYTLFEFILFYDFQHNIIYLVTIHQFFFKESCK